MIYDPNPRNEMLSRFEELLVTKKYNQLLDSNKVATCFFTPTEFVLDVKTVTIRIPIPQHKRDYHSVLAIVDRELKNHSMLLI